MKPIFVLDLLLLLLLLGCTEAPQRNGAPPIPKQNWTDKGYENFLLHLSSQRHPQPNTLDEKQQNIIIEHALKHELPIQKLEEGIWYVVHRRDSTRDKKLEWGQKVSVHYQGRFLDGKTFDSSYDNDEPMEFYIGNMIHGWNTGLQQLQRGDFATFLIASRLAYGEKGMKDSKEEFIIPPNKPLRFDIEVLDH